MVEVLDKLPSLGDHLVTGFLVGTAGFVACLRWRRAAYVVVPVAGYFVWAAAARYLDPALGLAAWREGGWPYALAIASSCLAMLGLPAWGAWLLRHPAPPPLQADPLVQFGKDFERSKARTDLFLDLADALLYLLMPHWWRSPGGSDEQRRGSVLLTLVALAVCGLLLAGAWLTGSF